MKVTHKRDVTWYFEVEPEGAEWPDFKKRHGTYIMRPFHVRWSRTRNHFGELERCRGVKILSNRVLGSVLGAAYSEAVYDGEATPEWLAKVIEQVEATVNFGEPVNGCQLCIHNTACVDHCPCEYRRGPAGEDGAGVREPRRDSPDSSAPGVARLPRRRSTLVPAPIGTGGAI